MPLEAQDLIRGLCTVDRTHRLGNIECGAFRVKRHPFFRGIDWDALYYKRIPGPIRPPVRYPGDTQCFDTYPDESTERVPYTDELAEHYEDAFKEF